MREFRLSDEVMTELETFSAKVEQLGNFIDLVNDFVWGEIVNGAREDAIDKLGCLTETLSEVVRIRDKELEEIITKVKPLA